MDKIFSKNHLESLRYALEKATNLCDNWIGEWPEDEWVAINDYWDLNVFTINGKNIEVGSLYPVVDGQTNTSVPISIWIN